MIIMNINYHVLTKHTISTKNKKVLLYFENKTITTIGLTAHAQNCPWLHGQVGWVTWDGNNYSFASVHRPKCLYMAALEMEKRNTKSQFEMNVNMC